MEEERARQSGTSNAGGAQPMAIEADDDMLARAVQMSMGGVRNGYYFYCH